MTSLATDNPDELFMIEPEFEEQETSMLSAEEELMESHWVSQSSSEQLLLSFPGDCLNIVRLMKGNKRCVDCQEFDAIDGISVEPMYASVSHGTLICGQCAKVHSKRKDLSHSIRSFLQSKWSFSEVISMLEGGNHKFRQFCAITNAFPSIHSNVNNRKQFIHHLYSSSPVKAYRLLLQKSVVSVLSNKESLIDIRYEKEEQMSEKKSNQFWDDNLSDPNYCKRYIRTLPMLSILDFHAHSLRVNSGRIFKDAESIQSGTSASERKENTDEKLLKIVDEDVDSEEYQIKSDYSFTHDNSPVDKRIEISGLPEINDPKKGEANEDDVQSTEESSIISSIGIPEL